jgi:hypothetical protein
MAIFSRRWRSPAEQVVADRLRGVATAGGGHLPHRQLDQGSTGVCRQYRDVCWLGCPYGAYFSTHGDAPAMATGRPRLPAIASEVLYDADRKRATVRDGCATREVNDYSAHVVFPAPDAQFHLVAAAFSDRRWPGGLGSSSGELGHNLMDHHFRVGSADRRIEDQYVRAAPQPILHPAVSRPWGQAPYAGIRKGGRT